MVGLIPCFPCFRRAVPCAGRDDRAPPDAGDAFARDEGLACNGTDSEPGAPDSSSLSY
jgi:hypothetical protein